MLYSENNLLNTGVKMGATSQQKKKERKERKKDRPTDPFASIIHSVKAQSWWMDEKEEKPQKERRVKKKKKKLTNKQGGFAFSSFSCN